MAHQKTLSIAASPLDESARDAYARAMLHDGFSGGLASLDDLVRGASFFEVSCSGRVVGRYCLRVAQYANGCEGVVVSAAGDAVPGIDFTRDVMPFIEAQFIDVRSIQIVTARRGLVSKLARHGYSVEGYIVRKRLRRD